MEFERIEIEKVLLQEVMEPAQKERTVQIVFALMKDECMRFCVDNWRMNAVPNRDLYLIARMDECTDGQRTSGILYLGCQ